MKNSKLIGTILIGLIIVGYAWYSSNQAEKVNQQRAAQRAEMNAKALAEGVKTDGGLQVESQATTPVQEESKLSNTTLQQGLVAALNGVEKFYTLENDKMIVTVSNKGGAIVSVELKDYKNFNGGALMLYEYPNSKMALNFFTTQNINTSNYYFTANSEVSNLVVKGEGSEQLSMRLHLDESAYVEYLYTMSQGDMIDFDIRFVGVEKYLSPAQNMLMLDWGADMPRQERGYSYENQYTQLAYKYPNAAGIEKINAMGDAKQEEIDTKVEWVAFKEQYFSAIIVAKESFEAAELSYKSLSEDSGFTKNFNAELFLPYSPSTTGYGFSFFFGPNQYNIMKSYDREFQELLPLGWSLFRWISIFIIIPTFNFLSGFISSFGIIILLLTIFIKLIIFPFTYRSYLSMAKMRLIKPEIDKLNEKFPRREDAMKKQQAMMELYRKAGVNPMGGCLPMLFQLPIIIAMFRFFPASIELRGQSFLWVKDLASYDSILELPFSIPFYGDHVSLMAILMAVSMYFTSKINMQQNPSNTTQMPGMNFMMLYIMPIMLLVWFNNYSSGLCYYYLLSNVITIGQTVFIRRLVNEDKLRASMAENAKKPVKKSAFQQRMEDMAKKQQEQAKLRKK